MTNRTLIAVVLAATMMLAGCSGAPTTQTTAPTDDTAAATTTPVESTETTTEPTSTVDEVEDCKYSGEGDDDIVQESGACLGFDADQVYRNILNMTGEEDFENGPPVNSLSVEATTPYTFEDFGFEWNSFQVAMGIAPEGTPDVYSGGYTSAGGLGGVEVGLRYIGNQTSNAPSPGPTQNATEAEITAAHEFLHAMQFYKGYQQRLARNLSRPGVDYNLVDVETAMIEGSASYFEIQYQKRYMERVSEPRSVSRWANASAFSMYTLGPYVMGQRYTAFRVNDTSEFEKIYDNPALSTEQILHNYMPSEELPKNLSVSGEVSSDWSTPSSAKTKGELFLRSALRSGVSGPKAAAGAAGWGQDGLIEFQNTSYAASGNYKYGYGWAVRFDDASEAAEFESIFQEWLDAKGEIGDGVYGANVNTTYRFVAVSNETFVVLAGHEDFVTQATVSGNTTTVVVEHTSEDQTERVTGSSDERFDVVAPASAPVRR